MELSFRNLLQRLGIGGKFTPKTTQSVLRAKATHMRRAVRYLMAHGSITQADIRGSHMGKAVHRLRKLGYIMPMEFDMWEPSKDGFRHKRYYWTGKVLIEGDVK